MAHLPLPIPVFAHTIDEEALLFPDTFAKAFEDPRVQGFATTFLVTPTEHDATTRRITWTNTTSVLTEHDGALTTSKTFADVMALDNPDIVHALLDFQFALTDGTVPTGLLASQWHHHNRYDHGSHVINLVYTRYGVGMYRAISFEEQTTLQEELHALYTLGIPHPLAIAKRTATFVMRNRWPLAGLMVRPTTTSAHARLQSHAHEPQFLELWTRLIFNHTIFSIPTRLSFPFHLQLHPIAGQVYPKAF